MSNFRWNYRSIVFLLSLLDILAILIFYPAKSQAELPKSDVSTTQVEENKASEAVVNQTVDTSIAPVTRKKAPNDLRDRVTPVSQLLQVAPPTDKKAPNNAAGQVTSVSQLSDIKPTDWAFQALQSLVERYGVIAGYTDVTFKGDRSLTRYEFAAGLMDWAVGMAFPDLFSEGALGGVLVGMEPKLTSLSKGVDLGAGAGQADKDTSLHVEAFYQYKIGDHIEVTPGVIWITAPNSDASNPDSLFAWVRTVFRF